MDENVVADARFRHIGEIDLLGDAAEIDLADADDGIVAGDAQDPSRNR